MLFTTAATMMLLSLWSAILGGVFLQIKEAAVDTIMMGGNFEINPDWFFYLCAGFFALGCVLFYIHFKLEKQIHLDSDAYGNNDDSRREERAAKPPVGLNLSKSAEEISTKPSMRRVQTYANFSEGNGETSGAKQKIRLI